MIFNAFFASFIFSCHILKAQKTNNNIQLQYLNLKIADWTADLKTAMKDDGLVRESEFMSPEVATCQAFCPNIIPESRFTLTPNCSTYPLYIADSEIDENDSGFSSQAIKSLPCFMYLNISSIPNANIGVFTSVTIPEGYIFGPYEGRRGKTPNGEKESFDVKYTWSIGTDEHENGFFVDAINENESNWLRYVNSARYEEEQNLFAVLVDNDMYYYAYKEIRSNTELLVWYGEEYGEYLKITVAKKYNRFWVNQGIKAPPKSIVKCPSCKWSNK